MEKIVIVLPIEDARPSLDTYIDQLSADESHEVLIVPQTKTALQQIKTEHVLGIVLLDSKQLLPVQEVHKLIEALKENPDTVFIGARPKTGQTTLRKKLTTKLFQFFYGVPIQDIHSPWKAVPVEHLPKLANIKQTSEWNTRVLTNLAIEKIPMKEIPVKTKEENTAQPISIRVYFVLFWIFIKYSLSSFSSFLVDILFFQIFLFFTRDLDDQMRIILSTIGARIISSVYNFLVNNFIVFKNKQQHKQQWVRYYSLVIFEMLASSFLTAGIFTLIGWNETLIKILVDAGLFLIGYKIEKRFIF